MKKLTLLRSLSALAAGTALLAGCGGGGSSSDSALAPAVAPAPSVPTPPEAPAPAAPAPAPAAPATTALGPSAQYANICTLEAQKNFTRAYLDEVYLWYDEIVDVDPAQFSSTASFAGASNFSAVQDYFNALLVRTRDANGLPRDRFSAVLPSSLASDVTAAADTSRLLAASPEVPVTKTVATAAGRTVGYIQFNAFEFGAQDELIASFRQLQAQRVQDLVLDLRSNSGGFLYIAQTAASMITSPANAGRIFEQLHYNDKRTDISPAQSTLTFTNRVLFTESRFPAGTPLPQLSLPRVFVLTSGATCSASESVINSLRGIDVQVIRVGTTTCGKPYGFTQKNNCGIAYFPIEFQGTNAKGFGDYTTGFAPTCQVRDNPTIAPGSASDPLLNGALFYADNNACPAGTATGVQSAATPIVAPEEKPNRPAWRGRMLLPEQQPQR